MSTISSSSGFNNLNIALYNSSLAQSSISTLTAQSSSGLISSEYAGLGAAAPASLNLSGQIAVNTAVQANAAQAANVNQVAQNALGQIQTLVSGIANQLLGAGVSTDVGVSTLSATARSALGQVASLLDTKVGDIYVFAGQDSRTPPIPDPSNITQSAFYSAIQTAVGNLSTAGAAGVQTQVLAASGPGATSPFSASLEASNVPATADLGGGQTVQVGMLADRNTDAVSAGTGATSTGSYMRDALMALSTLGSLGSASSSDPQVQTLLSGTQTTLSQATDAMNVDIGGLGSRQSTITDAQTELTGTATALTTQLGAVQDVDAATVATQLANAQMQLQASYKIISSLSQLSLAKFL